MSNGAEGFWSYTHDDDDAEGGRIVQLAEDVRKEYRLITGRDIDIFVDKASLKWGDRWREKISRALQNTTFFIPIITPGFFTSKECRNETTAFINEAKRLGLNELVLAIRYADVPDLDEDSADAVKALIAGVQYEKWDDLRLEERHSGPYRKGVNRLATQLAELTRVVDDRPSQDPTLDAGMPALSRGDEEDDDEPGLIDRIAVLEEKTAAWASVMSELPPALNEFTEHFQNATAEIERRERSGVAPFAARLAVTKELAENIAAPVARLKDVSRRYGEAAIDADPSVRALITLLSLAESNAANDAGAKDAVGQITNLAETGRKSAAAMSNAADIAKEQAGFSRDIRKPLREFETAIRSMSDGQALIDEWERLAQEVLALRDL